jgi:ribonuclease E
LDDPKSGDIPIVISQSGVVLRMMRDCHSWQEKHQKARRTAKIRAGAAGIGLDDDESDNDANRRSAKSRKENRSTPREQSSVRKHARNAEGWSDSPESDAGVQYRKSTDRRTTSSRKRARETSNDSEETRPRHKGKDQRRGKTSSDEENDERRRKKKGKKLHRGGHRSDTGKDSHRSAKAGPSKRAIEASDSEEDTSESECSDM